MAFTGSIEDRLTIRELYGAYGDASWRSDREAWVACFTSEGRWTSHLFDCTGHEDLRRTWDSLWADWESVAFFTDIGSIEIADDTAQARSYAREIVKLKNGTILKLAGSYADSLVRSDGKWLFARRDYTMIIPEMPD